MSQVASIGGAEYYCGWVDDQEAVEEVVQSLPPSFQSFDICAADIKGTGAGQVALLYDFLRDICGGKYPTRNQLHIGSCVAVSSAGAVDVLQGVEQKLKGEREEFKAISAEANYGFARVEVGGGKLGNSDGATGAWQATAVSRYGCLTEELVGPYDVERCRRWGVKGVPDEYEPEARLHLVQSVTRVRSWEDVRDALANGYPVTMASSQGFSKTRDSEGFCSPSGTWNHQMFLNALDDSHRRPGACQQNSWGNYVGGPKRQNQPDGSFWVDADVIDRTVKSGDCWAYSSFMGFKPRKLDWRAALS